ncbi:hypothetical protein Tco_1414403, partial [Tanacetum coccineum]
PTFELIKGSCKSLVELEYFFEEVYKATTDQLDWINPEVTKTKAEDYGHIKLIEDLVPNRMWSQVPVSYDKHALWESHIGAKNDNNSMDLLLTWNLLVMSTPNTESLMLRTQDIEDMLLLLVQGKLTNLTVEERLAFNVSLRMFTRSIVIQRHVEDLQLAYSNPRGFIYQNKDKKNKLMCIDKLHKFSDDTLNDVRTALNDHLKGIRMKYLPQTIWRQSDKDKVGAMIQAIDK